jgi:hypothetical protein
MNVLGHERMIWEGHSQQQCIISAKGVLFIIGGSLELTSGVLPSSLLAVHKPVFAVTKNDTQRLSKEVSLGGGSVIVNINPALPKQESM